MTIGGYRIGCTTTNYIRYATEEKDVHKKIDQA